MGIFDFLKDKTAKQREDQILFLQKSVTDLKLAVRRNTEENLQMQEAIKERRRTLSRPLMYKTLAQSGDNRKDVSHTYYGPGYDLSEIGRAIDVEPYINQSVRKHREQVLKEGYRLNGSDDEMVDYVKNRLFDIALVSGITTMSLLREFTTNLIAYGSAFIVIKRDAERSSGSPIRMYGKDRDPIAALYILDPTSVTVAMNDYGIPVKWKQSVKNAVGNQNELTFDADDVIIATIDKKPGFTFGTPYIMPTLDDVRSLRRLEEIAELIGQRHAFPLLHFKVGTDELTAQVFDDGSNEIDMVKGLVENMSNEGGIVTSNRVEAEMLGGEKGVLDIVKYLDYFEQRVLGGLRLSEVDIGRGGSSSKASAVTVSQGLQESARDFQSVISDVLTHYLVLPLLLEGGFDVTVDNLVRWDFAMIDREEERAKQSHGQDLFLGGTITHDEFRKEYLNKKPCEEGELCKLQPNLEHERELEVQKVAGEQAIQKAKVSKSQSIKNKTANKNRPSNQHGRKPSKTKVTKNSLATFDRSSYIGVQSDLYDALRDNMGAFVNKHQGGVVVDEAAGSLSKDEEQLAIFEKWIEEATAQTKYDLDRVILMGSADFLEQANINGVPGISKRNIDRFYKNSVEKSFRKLGAVISSMMNASDALSGLTSEKDLSVISSAIFDQTSPEIEVLSAKHIDLAYRLGFSKTARAHGYSTMKLVPDGWHCEDCEEAGPIQVSLIDKDVPTSMLLSTHAGCEFRCEIGENKQ